MCVCLLRLLPQNGAPEIPDQPRRDPWQAMVRLGHVVSVATDATATVAASAASVVSAAAAALGAQQLDYDKKCTAAAIRIGTPCKIAALIPDLEESVA